MNKIIDNNDAKFPLRAVASVGQERRPRTKKLLAPLPGLGIQYENLLQYCQFDIYPQLPVGLSFTSILSFHVNNFLNKNTNYKNLHKNY